MFKDRKDAALQLCAKLIKYRGEEAIVYAIPRGGVVLGELIAEFLVCPLDIILSKKIGHPQNPELAIGAVSPDDVSIPSAKGISEKYIDEEIIRIREELIRKRNKFREFLPETSCEGKIALLVDDGIATGNTIISCANLLKKRDPKKIVFAIPVAPSYSEERLSFFCDDFICLLQSEDFYAVGQFYRDFDPVEDDQVLECLKRANRNYQVKGISR